LGLKALTIQLGADAQQRLRLHYDPDVISIANVDWFANTLQVMVNNGSRFEGGQTMQIGWSVVRFEQAADLLELREPDFLSMPTKWLPGISKSLQHLALHRDVVESVLPVEELAIPGMRQSCLACNRIGDGNGFFMHRTEFSGQDSGWFFGCFDREHNHDDAANLLRMSLYEVVVRRVGAALPFLALPLESMVALDRGRRSIYRYDLALEPKPGSCLANTAP
jgi:hypothetical protein